MTAPIDLSRSRTALLADRDPRAQRSIEALRDSLINLIERHPYEQITIDDIVVQAGVGRSTFYRHYATKEDLIGAVAKIEIDHLTEVAHPLLTPDDTHASCLALVTYVHERRRLWTALLTGGAAGLMREAFIQSSLRRSDAGPILSKLHFPVELAAAYGVAATFEVLSWWLRQSADVSVETVAHYLECLAVRPALQAPTRTR